MPGGENILDFLQLRQVLSTYNGDRRDPLWWPQERPVKIQDSTGEGETSREAQVLVLSRDHLSQLEKIQEVLPSRRDEAHLR